MADKKISELDLALLINNDAEFPISQDNAGEPTTFKGRITQLGTKIAEDMTFSNLQTTSKKLVGAINELLSLGSPIIIGTTAPTSSQGADGNIYIQYTAGTGGADDEVDGIYVKIDGAWCEIETGGGGGTTDYEDLSNKPQVNSVELVGNKSLDDLGIMPASLSKTATGSLVHITDGADNIPVKSLVSQIVATGGGGTPGSPIAINGFDSGIITVTDNDQITNTYTFAFGQTVYGGRFDNKGNLVVTWAAIDLGSLTWTYDSTNDRFLSNPFNIDGLPTVRTMKCLCSCYQTISDGRPLAQVPNNSIYNSGGAKNLIVHDNRFTVGTDLKTAVSGQYCTYQLETPITLAITSQDIPTLLGENNIFSNTGDVEVTYYTDNADEIVEVVKATASTPLCNYSTDEQVVGTWIDGKPLYERVIDLGADTNISYDSWTLTTVSLSEIDRLVLIQGLNSTGAAYYGDLYGGNNNGYLQLLTGRNGTYVSVRYLIFRYTKSST